MLVCLHFARLPMALCCEPYKSSVVASEKWEKGLDRFTMSSIRSLLYSTITSVSKHLSIKVFFYFFRSFTSVSGHTLTQWALIWIKLNDDCFKEKKQQKGRVHFSDAEDKDVLLSLKCIFTV